ncbi:MAG: PKD domain-containing protein [Anaerolineae bacterium]
MQLQRLLDQFQNSSTPTKLAFGLLAIVWTIVLAGVMTLGILFFASPSGALPATPAGSTPTITLNPTTGSAGSSVMVQGQGWNPGDMILIYLLTGPEAPDYALASAVADAEGQFNTNLIIPLDSRWTNSGVATVIARTGDNGDAAQATLNITDALLQPTIPVTAVATATPAVTPTTTLSPAPTTTPLPGAPGLTTTTDLNVRGGPDTAYPALGLLKAGQTAEITGRNADGGWWQIKFLGVAGERGWVAAKYASTQNVSNVPIVQAPGLPPTPQPTVPPTATPVVITDWRGEYYSNPNLSGAPLMVRNDVAVSFNWRNGSPAANLPSDGFSARWTRNLGFPAGEYRFWLTVDDGVRLWVDSNLVIDQWRDGSPTTFETRIKLSEGIHSFRIEYYERSGGALIDLGWRRESGNQPPQPVAGGPYLAAEGSTIILDGRQSKDPDGKIVKYEWDFNYDGYNFNPDAAGKETTAFYGDGPATITIALRVTDDRGACKIAATTVTVQNLAPAVEASGPYAGQAGTPINLVSAANDASPNDNASLNYRWDFGDGTNGSGASASHVYTQPGNYVARLTVIDKDGASASDTATVQVKGTNQTPVAVITAPSQGEVAQALTFDGSNSYDNDGSITGYTWNFGDGASANGQQVSHSFEQPGLYQITLTVSDNGGLNGSSTFTVKITAKSKTPPVAVISGPDGGMINDQLSFAGTQSSDTDGQIISYAWNFGDGATADGSSVSHSYAQFGTYQITLIVTDNDGLTAQATHTVQVDEPVQLQLPPVVAFTGPVNGTVGQSLSFDASASHDPDGQIVSYAWNFGDGTTQSSDQSVINYNYTQPGLYTVTLTVTDNDGLSDSYQQPITITVEMASAGTLPPAENSN